MYVTIDVCGCARVYRIQNQVFQILTYMYFILQYSIGTYRDILYRDRYRIARCLHPYTHPLYTPYTPYTHPQFYIYACIVGLYGTKRLLIQLVKQSIAEYIFVNVKKRHTEHDLVNVAQLVSVIVLYFTALYFCSSIFIFRLLSSVIMQLFLAS